MLATPDALDVVAWIALTPLSARVGAVAGAALHGRAVVDPLSVHRRADRQLRAARASPC